MKKFECNKCHFKTDCTFTGSVKPECCAVSKKFFPDWHEVEEVVTACSQLPKLTAEVFDRPDCPEWAKWAAVNADGSVRVFLNNPTHQYKLYWYDPTSYWEKQIMPVGKYDASDWRNSLIERPAKALPDWVKECAVGYDNEQERYFEITNVDEKWVDIEYLDDGIGATCDYSDIQICSEAKKRPFNAEEMKALVGKILSKKSYDFRGLIHYVPASGGSICVSNFSYTAEELMATDYTIDGKPCYVLEHLENGEWVE